MKHSPPFICEAEACGKAFRYRKDLDRHRKTKHLELFQEPVIYHSPYEGCKFSLVGVAGISRGDNLNRHI
ncbi:hypothetical protein P152DRAFT_456486 [Eremomyces bilateralis CBS 781.70]|uniref:C2H2-type domain-containing protein n=1 Tax=Eremomyces bilateralis CBS 781.70 TaxID=1392243 RepID=A0A6G1G866_9PEZI|nr:uncharacterized protein P152DRAFT_456486 [Eremomyces bilateralis CBS 781.70]KAF1814257.1 hypothetical protein P152DRAFT_456486 [Eremomyces bilateralis CBS 781.70]